MHVGGTLAEVARSEADVNAGRHPERPTAWSRSRAWSTRPGPPPGSTRSGRYCHVPSGSTVDMTGRIEAQIERFAPGFRDLILARSVMTAADMERYNPNYVGGDINGGAADAAADVLPAHAALEPVPDPAARRLPVLGVHPAGRRRARHVRRGRRPDGARRPGRQGAEAAARRVVPPRQVRADAGQARRRYGSPASGPPRSRTR